MKKKINELPIEFTIKIPFRREGVPHKILRFTYNTVNALKNIIPYKKPKTKIENISINTNNIKKYYEQKISIIIPVFYTSEPLQEQINTILCQDYTNYEIVIINDNPLTTIRINTKKNKQKMFIIHQQRHSGRSAARNMGSITAKGDILVFMDSRILLKNNNILEKINKYYLFRKNNHDILKFNVNYDPIQFETNNKTGDITTNPSHFMSNFFACTKKQYYKYKFDEQYGIRWGVEDHDFAHGQILNAKARIVFNNIISGYSIDEKFDIKRHITKWLECGINHRYFMKKWKLHNFFYYDSAWCNRENNWLIHEKENEIIKILSTKIIQLKKMLQFENSVFYMSPYYSKKLYELKWETAIITKIYSYKYCFNNEDINKIIIQLNLN